MDISGKHVVITGASSGIGFFLLKELLKKECKVVAAARRMEKISWEDEHVFPKRCDVSDPKQLEELFSFAREKIGFIDIFIANAGFAYHGRYQSADWERIETILNTNVASLCYSAGKMVELSGDRPFSFVCIASAMSFLPLPGYALYGATKSAVHGFAESFRQELQPDQRVQVVYPVATETEFFSTAGTEHRPWPVQKADLVARRIVRGIEKKKKRIFPSKLFQIALAVFPFFLKGYAAWEKRRFTSSIREMGQQQ